MLVSLCPNMLVSLQKTKQEFHVVGALAINRFATWYVVHDASWHAEVYRLPSLAVSPSPRLWMAWRGASG